MFSAPTTRNKIDPFNIDYLSKLGLNREKVTKTQFATFGLMYEIYFVHEEAANEFRQILTNKGIPLQVSSPTCVKLNTNSKERIINSMSQEGSEKSFSNPANSFVASKMSNNPHLLMPLPTSVPASPLVRKNEDLVRYCVSAVLAAREGNDMKYIENLLNAFVEIRFPATFLYREPTSIVMNTKYLMF